MLCWENAGVKKSVKTIGVATQRLLSSAANLDGGSDTESQTASSQQSDSGMRSSFSSQQLPSQAQHNRSPGSKSGLSQSASSVQQHQQPPQTQQAVDLSGSKFGIARTGANFCKCLHITLACGHFLLMLC